MAIPLKQELVGRTGGRETLAIQQNPVCLIHIGYHRTGTSFLQTELFPRIPDSFYASDPHEVERCARNPGLRLAILTNESLSNDLNRDTPELACELGRQFPGARILIGVRSQYTIMRGFYHLHLKSGTTESYEAFIKNRCGHVFDYARTVDVYREVFGSENVFVLPHEDLTRDPVGRMAALLQFAGADPGLAGSITNRRIKPSAGDATMRFLRLRNRIISPIRLVWPRLHAGITYRGLPLARILDDMSSMRLRLPVDRVRPILRDAYADSNARLFASLGLNIADYDYPQPGRA